MPGVQEMHLGVGNVPPIGLSPLGNEGGSTGSPTAGFEWSSTLSRCSRGIDTTHRDIDQHPAATPGRTAPGAVDRSIDGVLAVRFDERAFKAYPPKKGKQP